MENSSCKYIVLEDLLLPTISSSYPLQNYDHKVEEGMPWNGGNGERSSAKRTIDAVERQIRLEMAVGAVFRSNSHDKHRRAVRSVSFCVCDFFICLVPEYQKSMCRSRSPFFLCQDRGEDIREG